jgi:hypothetical protein
MAQQRVKGPAREGEPLALACRVIATEAVCGGLKISMTSQNFINSQILLSCALYLK